MYTVYYITRNEIAEKKNNNLKLYYEKNSIETFELITFQR